MAPNNQSTAPQDPAEGGSYVRNGDGTLTRVDQTQPAVGRAARAASEQAAAAPAAPANNQPQE